MGFNKSLRNVPLVGSFTFPMLICLNFARPDICKIHIRLCLELYTYVFLRNAIGIFKIRF